MFGLWLQRPCNQAFQESYKLRARKVWTESANKHQRYGIIAFCDLLKNANAILTKLKNLHHTNFWVKRWLLVQNTFGILWKKWGLYPNSVEGLTWFLLFGLLRLLVATYRTKFGFKLTGLNKPFQWCPWISPIYYQSRDIDNFWTSKISEKRRFLSDFFVFCE